MDLAKAIETNITGSPDQAAVAKEFLYDQIGTNGLFFNDLISYYNNSSDIKQKNTALFFIKEILYRDPLQIDQNVQFFLNSLISAVFHTQDLTLFYSLANIANLAFESQYENGYVPPEVVETILKFFGLYRTEKSSISFCIQLFIKLRRDSRLYQQNIDFFTKIIPDISLNGLTCDQISTQILTVFLFIQYIKFKKINIVDSEEFSEYYKLINELVIKSSTIADVDFIRLWKSLGYLENARQIFESAQKILSIENLSMQKKKVLYRYICLNEEFLTQKDIEPILNDYFEIHIKNHECLDQDEILTLILNLSKLDQNLTFKICKEFVIKCMNSEDLKIQSNVISMFYSILYVFPQFDDQKSELISIALKVAKNSMMSSEKVLNVFLEVFAADSFNINDLLMVCDFIIDILINGDNQVDVNYIHRVCSHFQLNPMIFDKLISVYDKIPDDIHAYYFSILIYTFSSECSLSSEKYYSFLNYLIEKFNEYSQIFCQLKKICFRNNSLDEDSDELIEYNKIAILLGSASNILLYLSFFDPIRLGDYLETCIETFINITEDDSLYDYKSGNFNIISIINDFTIFKTSRRE